MKYDEPNLKLFRSMSEPHESLEAADQTIKAFLNELGELREKHKIANVLTVIADSAKTADGDDTEFIMPHMYGDSLRMEALAAYAFGQAAVIRQESMGALQKGSLKSARRAHGERS